MPDSSFKSGPIKNKTNFITRRRISFNNMLIPFFCNGNPKIWKNERTWDVLERCIEHSFALSTFPGAVLSLWSGMPEQLHVFSYSYKSTIGQYTHAPLLLVQPGAISVMLATSHTGSFSKMLKPKKILNWNKVCLLNFKVLIGKFGEVSMKLHSRFGVLYL